MSAFCHVSKQGWLIWTQ